MILKKIIKHFFRLKNSAFLILFGIGISVIRSGRVHLNLWQF